MYYKEHEPAHFHAEYAGQAATIDFSGELIAANWAKMKTGQALEAIEPLSGEST